MSQAERVYFADAEQWVDKLDGESDEQAIQRAAVSFAPLLAARSVEGTVKLVARRNPFISGLVIAAVALLLIAIIISFVRGYALAHDGLDTTFAREQFSVILLFVGGAFLAGLAATVLASVQWSRARERVN